MSYFKVLGLDKEPFSTSPDPNFFFESEEHRAALMRLMIEIRLKRGLSVILGDVGTGKTTLSRKLFQLLKERQDIIFHMILDPTAESETVFLESLVRTFKIEMASGASLLDYKEAIKRYLFEKGVEEGKTIVLLIDEAQKLNSLGLEILRVLLNYETTEYKLLQLVLLGQIEFLPKLKEIRNVWDRISLKFVINPLDERQTRELIDFRLHQAGYNSSVPFFTDEAASEIYEYTKGYPRRISLICHNALKSLVMENKPVVDLSLIKNLISQEVRVGAAV
jgi:general secretion pathway protein A